MLNNNHWILDKIDPTVVNINNASVFKRDYHNSQSWEDPRITHMFRTVSTVKICAMEEAEFNRNYGL